MHLLRGEPIIASVSLSVLANYNNFSCRKHNLHLYQITIVPSTKPFFIINIFIISLTNAIFLI